MLPPQPHAAAVAAAAPDDVAVAAQGAPPAVAAGLSAAAAAFASVICCYCCCHPLHCCWLLLLLPVYTRQECWAAGQETLQTCSTEPTSHLQASAEAQCSFEIVVLKDTASVHCFPTVPALHAKGQQAGPVMPNLHAKSLHSIDCEAHCAGHPSAAPTLAAPVLVILPPIGVVSPAKLEHTPGHL